MQLDIERKIHKIVIKQQFELFNKGFITEKVKDPMIVVTDGKGKQMAKFEK